MRFIGNMYKDASLYKKCLYILLSQLCEKRQAQIYSMEVKMLFALDYFAQDLMMTRSKVPHAAF